MTAEYSEATKTTGRRATEAGESVVSNLQQTARDYLDRGKERVMELEEGLEGVIQEHPIRSILIAAGVGLVAGVLISRR